jgi:hypothetical protein
VDPTAIPAAELTDLDADHPAEYLPLAATRNLSVATGAKGWPTTDIPAGQEALALVVPVQLYHVARDATNAIMSLPRGVAVHLAAPAVTMHTLEPVLGPDHTVSSVVESLDLLHRGFGTLPVAGTAATVPGALLAGVTSHVAERLRNGAGLPSDLAVATPGISVGALFDQAAAEGVSLRLIQGSVPADLAYPPEATARLNEAFAAGWVAVALERAIAVGPEDRLGWWLIDPATGATVDVMDDGRGAAMAENAVLMGVLIGSMLGTILMQMALCATRIYHQVTEHLELMNSTYGNFGWSVGDVPARNFAC